MLIASGSRIFVDSDSCQRSCSLHFFSSFSKTTCQSLIGRKRAGDRICIGRRIFRCAEQKSSYSWVKSYLCPNPSEVVLQLLTEDGRSQYRSHLNKKKNVHDELSRVEPCGFREGVELFGGRGVDWTFVDLITVGNSD